MAGSHADFARYTDLSIQRQQSIDFAWGHDHDFGTFKVNGQMGTRHIKHMAVFHDHFTALPYDLKEKRVLDIGCWTGGVSLLLSACGAEVVAIDEVRKYCDTLKYLGNAFGVNSLTTQNMSLYDLGKDEFQDSFDVVVFAGVLYHLTDVIIAMRHIFNVLKDGGVCLLESTGVQSSQALFGYERREWNWFDPSPKALHQLFLDVGFKDISVGNVTPNGRLYGVGRREKHVDMRRDGLSIPSIR